MNFRRRVCPLLLGFVIGAWAVEAVAAYRDDAVKAAFLYRFTGYVEWPATTLQAGTFDVAVLGSRNVARELTRLLTKYPVKNLPARVRQIETPAEAADAHLLYVGPGYPGDVHEAVQAVGTGPVLVVTDRAGALDEGSTVNFLVVDRRVRFEVSIAAANRAGLKLSPQLLAVAARVRGALVPWLPRACPTDRPPQDSFDRSCRVRIAAL